MANKLNKIKIELIGQYLRNTWDKKTNKFITSECDKDYDRMSIQGSMSKAFERGFRNCESIYEEAIKKWAKKVDMNASSVLFRIKQEFNDEKIKLK